MRLIDTHAHLYWDDYKSDLDEVIERSIGAGIDTAIIVGTDLVTSSQATNFTHPKLQTYSTVGIHPHEASKYFNNDELIQQHITQLEQIVLTSPNKVKAIGECGLDFFFNGNPDYQSTDLTTDEQKQLQIKLLKAQVNLAKKLDLPLVIHCREAWDQIFDYIGDHYGVLHCYSGDEKITKQALQTKFMISFAANITYPKNQYLRDTALSMPLDRILLETDCPFLSPQSSRGERNEPKSVRESARLISEIRNTTIEEIAQHTTANAKKVFSIT